MARPTPHAPANGRAVAALAIALGLWATPSTAQNVGASPPLGLRATDAGALDAPAISADPFAAEAPPGAGDPTISPPDKKKAKTKKTARGAPRLPPLRPYARADRNGQPGGPPQFDPARAPPPTVATPAPPGPRRPRPEDKPFDPTGILVGDINLLPSIEEDVGYASNPLALPGQGKGSAYETTQAALTVQSEWARNDLHGSLTAGYSDYFSAPQASAPNGNGVLGGRYDISRDTSLDAEARYSIATQTPGSVTLPSGVILGSSKLPLVETFGATAGGAQKFGDLTVALHGTLDQTNYENATLSDGTVEDLSSDNYNDWGLNARVSYQISPVIAPFVETVIDTRRYFTQFDSGGYDRQSNGALGRVGATLALTGQLTGQASLGYGEREYRDPRLPNLAAPLVDASLVWSATPLTTVTLKTSTNLSDTTNPGDSGAVTRAYTIDVSHAFWRNLTLGADVGYTTDVYAGVPLHDSTISFGLKADYNISRDIVLRASASRAQYTTSTPGSNYDADIFMLGVRFQR